MIDFFQLLVGAIALGAIYALIALGFNLIFATSRLMNFAQGDLAMLGAMVGVTFGGTLKLPFPLVALAAAGGVGLLFFLFEFAVLRSFVRRKATLTSMVMATLALSLFLQGAAEIVWGRLEHPVPSPVSAEPIHLGGVVVSPHYLVVVGVSLLAFAVMYAFFRGTLLGKALLATGYEPESARLVGINPTFMVALTFFLGGGFAALAGLVVSPITFAAPWMGLSLAVKGFAAAMIGGLGSVAGALIGGLIVGLLETLGAGYVSSAYADVFIFLSLMLVLFFMPSGLLGSPLVTGEHF
jgi:branched-chain amino acid transport system permease protein